METLGQLEPATLGQHADADVTRLKESDEDVRQAALMMLGNLEPTTLAQHSDAVVAMLYDSVWAWRLQPSRPVGPEGWFARFPEWRNRRKENLTATWHCAPAPAAKNEAAVR